MFHSYVSLPEGILCFFLTQLVICLHIAILKYITKKTCLLLGSISVPTYIVKPKSLDGYPAPTWLTA